MENRGHGPGRSETLEHCPRGWMRTRCVSLQGWERELSQNNKAFVFSSGKCPGSCASVFIRLSPLPLLFFSFSQGMEDPLTTNSSRQSKVSFVADFLFQANILYLTWRCQRQKVGLLLFKQRTLPVHSTQKPTPPPHHPIWQKQTLPAVLQLLSQQVLRSLSFLDRVVLEIRSHMTRAAPHPSHLTLPVKKTLPWYVEVVLQGGLQTRKFMHKGNSRLICLS